MAVLMAHAAASFARTAVEASPLTARRCWDNRSVVGRLACAVVSHTQKQPRYARRFVYGHGNGRGHSSFWEPAGDVMRSVQIDFRPKRIILLRHGESSGNVDDSAYVTTPDWRVPLTDRGLRQAHRAGVELREKIGPDGRLFLYNSPYLRTRETLDEMAKCLDAERIVAVREEPRISEQQFGNFQNVKEVLDSKGERHRFGRFYYRFPSGEAGLDVYSRVSSFITTLVRDCHTYNHQGYDLESMNVVIVTHGLALRLFLMRWFQWTVEEFEMSENPENARLITMNKMCGPDGHRYYQLDDGDRRGMNLPERCGLPRNVHLHGLGPQGSGGTSTGSANAHR